MTYNLPMGEDLDKQKTPKGYEIPVPKRGDFMRDLKRAAETPPPKESETSDPKK
jgi:hypothetical protein